VTLLVGLAGHAGASASEAQLVILAEPSPPAGIATSSGSVTLPYRVVEVFSGEPGAASVIVRHPRLDPMDRERLASDARVILLAKPDDESPGRWLGSAPLRATEEAIAAFRKWGAPSDVRESTPLSAAVAVAQSGAASVETESVPAPAEWHDAPEAEVADVAREPPGRAAAPPALPRAEAMAPPLPPDDAPQALPSRPSAALGPGLPPVPTRRILGPPFARRDDLKIPDNR
jgi:hypothetical protein